MLGAIPAVTNALAEATGLAPLGAARRRRRVRERRRDREVRRPLPGPGHLVEQSDVGLRLRGEPLEVIRAPVVHDVEAALERLLLAEQELDAVRGLPVEAHLDVGAQDLRPRDLAEPQLLAQVHVLGCGEDARHDQDARVRDARRRGRGRGRPWSCDRPGSPVSARVIRVEQRVGLEQEGAVQVLPVRGELEGVVTVVRLEVLPLGRQGRRRP